jgi:hypothetical protein
MLPEIPVLGDFVSGYLASAWLGLAGRRQHSRHRINTVSKVAGIGSEAEKRC